MTLALVAKISVAHQALKSDQRLHELAHEFLVARLRAAREAGAEKWTYPIQYC
ncbi:MAG: hypothetical protein HY928_05850 [Elusimicrobia bacterium]|nr:hypothetical protein [Elusimicrobiota bacterium]